MRNCEGFPTIECPDHAPAVYDMLGYQLCEKCADRWRANDTKPSPVDALAERDAEIERLRGDMQHANEIVAAVEIKARAEFAALRVEIAELNIRLAEYRSVNQLATAALEKYFARFGALS